MIYAIDFGTSNSLLGAADQERIYDPIPLDPTASDTTVLRSILYFPSMRNVFYGAAALKEFHDRPGEGRLIRSIKKYLPMRSFIGTWIEDRPVNLEDIIGFFLAEMRRRANQHFGRDVDRVVLGRPAKFSPDSAEDNFAQFRLEQAAKRAGFKEIHFFPEPVAAALEFRDTLTSAKNVLVADFGGGTSDFTVMRMDKGTHKDSDVLSIGGIALAGDALDGEVMRKRLAPYFGADVAFSVPFGSNVLKMPTHLMEKICSPADMALLLERDVVEFLRNVEKWAKSDADRKKVKRLFCVIQDQLGFPIFEAIEKAKRTLSNSEDARIQFLYPEVELDEALSRVQFESYSLEKVSKILTVLDETLTAAGLRADQIDVVCCTGGTAKVPILQRELVKRFGPEKVLQHNHFHSVVEGLCRRARELV